MTVISIVGGDSLLISLQPQISNEWKSYFVPKSRTLSPLSYAESVEHFLQYVICVKIPVKLYIIIITLPSSIRLCLATNLICPFCGLVTP